MTNINLNLSLNATVNFNFEGGVQGTQAGLMRQKKAVKVAPHNLQLQPDKNGRVAKSKVNKNKKQPKGGSKQSAAESSSSLLEDKSESSDTEELLEDKDSSKIERRGSIKGTKSKKKEVNRVASTKTMNSSTYK